MNHKITAIIPARGNSKSIPHKNIRDLGGYPMIAYSIAAARMSKLISNIIVTTNSAEIADISRQYGAEVPFLRPDDISQDDSVDLDFFKHYIDYCREDDQKPSEYLVHLRPTTPLREIEVIDKGIQQILDLPDATSLRSVHATDFNPYKVFYMNDEILTGFFPDHPENEYYNFPRQQFPAAYIPNGNVDIVRVSTIDSGSLHGAKMIGFLTEKGPDIDNYSDLDYAWRALKEERFTKLRDWLQKNSGFYNAG